MEGISVIGTSSCSVAGDDDDDYDESQYVDAIVSRVSLDIDFDSIGSIRLGQEWDGIVCAICDDYTVTHTRDREMNDAKRTGDIHVKRRLVRAIIQRQMVKSDGEFPLCFGLPLGISDSE